MPHPLFVAHWTMMPKLQAEEMLSTASAMHATSDWWDTMLVRARGIVAEVVKRAGPLFTWNGAPVNSSNGLRQRFAQHVTGGRVES